MSAPGEYAVMVCRYSDRQGDFDNNGILDIYDAVALLRYSVGLDSGENLQLIDLNGDGLVNLSLIHISVWVRFWDEKRKRKYAVTQFFSLQELGTFREKVLLAYVKYANRFAKE